MNRILLRLAVFLMVSQHVCAAHDALGGLKLLEGYSMKRGSAVDAHAWTIEERGGLKISFEAGPSEGSWADPNERDKYSWFREQKVNGYTARFALVKHGLRTQWEPGDSRGLPPGNILLAWIIHDFTGEKRKDAMRFKITHATPGPFFSGIRASVEVFLAFSVVGAI